MNKKYFIKKTLILFSFLMLKKNFSLFFFKRKNIFLKKFKKHIWILDKNDF